MKQTPLEKRRAYLIALGLHPAEAALIAALQAAATEASTGKENEG